MARSGPLLLRLGLLLELGLVAEMPPLGPALGVLARFGLRRRLGPLVGFLVASVSIP